MSCKNTSVMLARQHTVAGLIKPHLDGPARLTSFPAYVNLSAIGEGVIHERVFCSWAICFISSLQFPGPHACASTEGRRDRLHFGHSDRFDFGVAPRRRSR